MLSRFGFSLCLMTAARRPSPRASTAPRRRRRWSGSELGHLAIGRRVFSDWRVALKRLDKGEPDERAVFAIGMTKGALREISVE